MARHVPDDLRASENVSARITRGEAAALAKLCEARGRALMDQGEIPDESFAGWLRSTIRKMAAERGIPLEVPAEEAAPRPAAKSSAKRRARA